LQLFYSGEYLTRPVGQQRLAEILSDYARAAMTMGGQPDLMTGETPTPEQILATILGDDTDGRHAEAAQGHGEPPGGRPAGSDPGQARPAGQRPGDGTGRDGTGGDRQAEPAGPAGTAGTAATQAGVTPAGQQSVGAPDAPDAPDDFALTAPTPDELRARADQEQSAQAEQAQRDAAPPAGDFALIGSDRAVDRAIAAGQMELAPAETGQSRPDDGRVTRDSSLADGTTVYDGEGKPYRVHYQRNDLVVAHPIINGVPQVSADTTVRFWVSPDRAASGEADRTDPIFTTAQSVASTVVTEKAERSRPTGRFERIPVPAETARWMGLDGARAVRADLQALYQRHTEYYDSPTDVRRDIDFVLDAPDGWYIHSGARVVLFRERPWTGAIPQARVEVEADATDMTVRSVYVGNKRQIAKKMADKRKTLEGLGLGGQSPDSLTVAEYLKALDIGSSRPAPPSGGAPEADASVPQSDAGHKATAGSITDVGQELYANRRNFTGRGIKWEDIAGLNDTLKVKETTKARVWPRPSYERLVDDGLPPLLARMVKQVYDGISAGPNLATTPTDEDLRRYIDTVSKVREGLFDFVNDREAVQRFASAALELAKGSRAAAGSSMDTRDVAQTLLRRLWPATAGKVTRVFAQGSEAHREILIIGGNRALAALQMGQQDFAKWAAEIGKGWPGKREVWQVQGYRVLAPDEYVVAGPKERHRYNRETGLTEPTGESYYEVAPAGGRKRWAMPQAPAAGAHLLVDENGSFIRAFDSAEAAVEAARERVKRGPATGQDIRGTNIEQAERTGPARRQEGENITSQRLMDTFGFRGVNFGREGWIKQAERQAYLNEAWDGLLDLADVLGVPSKAMSLNGELGIAFGAQGTGGSNAAHFVPGVNEINLTRTKGAGTLAHEWGHALDHYFATQAGLSKEDEPFLSNHASRPDTRERMVPEGGKYVRRVTPTFAESIRPEIVQAFRRIHEAMTRRAESAGEAAARREATLTKERKRLDGWLRAARQPIETSTAANKADLLAEFDQYAEKLRQGDVGDGYEQTGNVSLSARVAAVRNLIKDATGRLWPLDETRGLDASATFVRSLQGKKDADATHEPQRVATQFMADSTALDAAKGGKAYWSTPHEMFARAFELYVHDRLAAQGNSNTFLTDAAQRAQAPHQVVDRSSAFNRASGAMRDLYVYPIGKEREALVEAFDALVGEIKTRETDAGVTLFSRTGTGPGLSHAQAADAVDALLEPFEHAVPTRILESATGEIPGAVPDDHVSGAVHRGRVHLFLDELADRPALVRTLWHELLHYGLRRFLSRDEYIARMGELYGDDAWVRDRADDWMRSEQGRGVLRDHGMDYARARGVDEALGDLAETLGGAQDPRGALRRTLDAVTEWLARLADVFGFDAASTWLRTAPRQATARYVRSVFERLRDDAAATSSDWAFTADPAFASAPREVTYTITKVGRKWLEGKQSGKPYTNQIEINDASSGWKIGDTVTFMARTEFTSGRYGTTVQVFPMTAEAVASERAATENARNLAEIRRQLDFIEDSASRGQRYANGVDKVMALGIAAFPAEKARLDDALAKVRTASAAPRTYLRVAYAEKEQAKAHGARWDAERRQWYVHGAVPKALERFLPEQAGARPADAPRDRPATDTDRETLRIDRGSGYGGRPFSVGQVLRNPGHARNSAEPEFVTVLSASQRYFREDGLSFGVGDDQGYIYSATVRPATEAETALLIEREQAAEQRRATLRAVDELRTTFIRDGERPNPAEPAGEVLLNTFTIYGGGERWHIDREGGSIWYVRNNGADGDNWTANNVRTGGAGAIGWRMPWSAQAEHMLRDAALLKPGQTASRVLFSRSASTRQAYEARIDALFAGQPAARIGARVLDRSDLLDLLGMGDGAVHLAEGKVRAGMDSHPRMTAEVWKKIPQWLDDPAAVFDSDTVKGRMVFVAPELVAGSPVLIVVEPNAEIGATLQAHLLVNAYDKDRAPPFARWLRDDLARYVNQKKFPDVLARAGLQLPRKAENKPGTARILTEKNLAGYRRAAMSVAST